MKSGEESKITVYFLMLLICCICLYMFNVSRRNVPFILLLLFLFTAEIFCYIQSFLLRTLPYRRDSHSTFMACTMVYVSEDYENMQSDSR